VNAVEKLRHRLQVAMVVEAHKGTAEIPDVLALAERYSIKGDPTVIQSSIRDWEGRGLLIVSRTLDGTVYAALKRDSLADALSLVCEVLDADLFQVDWKKEEILTDAADDQLIAVPDGWKLFQVESERPKAIEPVPAPSGVHITNTFSPINNVTGHASQPGKRSISWSGWVGVAVAIASLIVALWLGGKI
jgi:hypothetical protein